MKGESQEGSVPDRKRQHSAASDRSCVTEAILEQARAVLSEELGHCAALGFQALLSYTDRLHQKEVISSAGEAFAVCVQVFQVNDLECRLELHASVQWLCADQILPLGLTNTVAITPDDKVLQL